MIPPRFGSNSQDLKFGHAGRAQATEYKTGDIAGGQSSISSFPPHPPTPRLTDTRRYVVDRDESTGGEPWWHHAGHRGYVERELFDTRYGPQHYQQRSPIPTYQAPFSPQERQTDAWGRQQQQGNYQYQPWHQPATFIPPLYPAAPPCQDFTEPFYGQQQYASFSSPPWLCVQHPQCGFVSPRLPGLTQYWPAINNVPTPSYAQGTQTSATQVATSTSQHPPPVNAAAVFNQQFRHSKQNKHSDAKGVTSVHSTQYTPINAFAPAGTNTSRWPWPPANPPLSYAPPNPHSAYRYSFRTSTQQQRDVNRSNDVPALTRGNFEPSTLPVGLTKPDVPFGKKPHEQLLPRPGPTEEYTKQAARQPQTRISPRPLLVILDLNGTLLVRKARNGSKISQRPHVNEFLHYLLANHRVMVWSSARPTNVEGMCAQLFTAAQQAQLVGVWTRDQLRIPKSYYNRKVQVYKQLTWVWADKAVQSARTSPTAMWDQTNTVLVDDSVEKAASEPHNLVCLDAFDGTEEHMQRDVLAPVVHYLEALRWQVDVSAYIHSQPFVNDASVSFDWTSVVDYTD